MDPALKEELYILVMEIIEDIDEPLKYDEDENILKITRARTNLNTLNIKCIYIIISMFQKLRIYTQP